LKIRLKTKIVLIVKRRKLSFSSRNHYFFSLENPVGTVLHEKNLYTYLFIAKYGDSSFKAGIVANIDNGDNIDNDDNIDN
jgi:hypothetical protein